MSDQDNAPQGENKNPEKQQLTLDPTRRTTMPHKPYTQTATGGRSVHVQVEVKKKRVFGPNRSRLSSDALDSISRFDTFVSRRRRTYDFTGSPTRA